MKVVNFLKTIQDSIYSPQFYSTVLTKSFRKSLGYFFLLILLLTTIRGVILINPFLVEAPKQLQKFTAEVINCYPKDLEVKIINGQVSINSGGPYFLSSCEGLGQGQNLAVIDTKTPFSSTKFDEYRVAIWVTKTDVVYKRNQFETRSYSLAQVKDFKLNKDSLKSFSNLLTPWIKFVGPVLLILAFLGIYLSYNFRLIHLLTIAALTFLLGKILKQNISFGQGYKVGLYAITLGLIVDLVVDSTARWTHLSGFPFMVTILTLAVVLVNLLFPKRTA